MIRADPAPGASVGDLIQWQADEVEFLYASMGETTDYNGFATHLQAEVDRGEASALVPRDPAFWRAVIAELHRREAGVITADNAVRLRLLDE